MHITDPSIQCKADAIAAAVVKALPSDQAQQVADELAKRLAS